MDRLLKLFTGKGSAERTEEKAKKRGSKRHGRLVRAREKELRRGHDDNGARNAKLFWGSPGQTFQNNVRGPGEGI